MVLVATQRNAAPTSPAPTFFTVSVATPSFSLMTYLSPAARGAKSCSPAPLRCQAYAIVPPSLTLACAVNVAASPASTQIVLGTCENAGVSMVGSANVIASSAVEKSLVTPCVNAATLTW